MLEALHFCCCVLERPLCTTLALASCFLSRRQLGLFDLPVHPVFPRRLLFGFQTIQERALLLEFDLRLSPPAPQLLEFGVYDSQSVGSLLEPIAETYQSLAGFV